MQLTNELIQQCRQQFPALQRTVNGHQAGYFDGPAGTQVPQRVIDAMVHYLGHYSANHGGLFPTSMESDLMLTEAHRALADFLGGSGRRPGGDGVIRQLEFLETLEVSLLSNRRGDWPPYGLAGGESGSIGRNLLVRKGGVPEELSGQVQLTVHPGDKLVIETPGGGGCGGEVN